MDFQFFRVVRIIGLVDINLKLKANVLIYSLCHE